MKSCAAALLAVGLLLACSPRRASRQTRLSDRLIALASISTQTTTTRRWLDRNADLALRHIEETGADPIEALNDLVFGELGFQREIEDDDMRFVLLPSVIADRRGSCVGLTQLYLSLAERLRLPMHAVLVPGHIFVRSQAAGQPRNIELLRRGQSMPHKWYVDTYALPPHVDAYWRALSDDEVVAVVHYNLGNALRVQRDLSAALLHYTVATLLFDDFPQAHASRGLTFQLQGDLDAAAAAYDRARKLDPLLPGLERNIATLAKERWANR